MARAEPARALARRTSGQRPGGRGAVLAAIAAAGVASAFVLELDPRQLIPGEGGLRVAGEFFSRALTPAVDYEADFVPEGIEPLPIKAARAALTTVVFATAALSLSLVLGLVLGVIASSSLWSWGAPARPGLARRLRLGAAAPAIYGATRLLIALMRSVHELLWAVLLLAAFGLNPLTAVLAIFIPYAGTLAKVFSEMLDEAPRDSAEALRSIGASPLQVFAFGLLPRALPDMIAYALYRFECALRSSAVLGFFGYPTLGYYIAASFENLHYGEVWTYLYTLLILVLAVDAWSGAVRRRLVAGEGAEAAAGAQ